MGIFSCYALLICYLLFQTVEDSRRLFLAFDSRLNTPLPEKQYASDCRLYTPENQLSRFYNIKNAMDIYILAHFFGWVIQALYLRDRGIAWSVSLLFEAVEFTFSDMLENFKECWWDHWGLDVFLCNLLGIEAGLWLCHHLQIMDYGWIVTDEEKGRCSLFKGFLKLFTPNVMEKYEWKMFSSVRRFLLVVWFILLSTCILTTGFFIKYLIWIPSSHYTVILRIGMWCGMSAMASKDMYIFIENKYSRFGLAIWLSHITIFLEVGLIVKWWRGMYKVHLSIGAIVFWLVLLLLVVGAVISISIKQRGVKEDSFNPSDPHIDIEE